jgi:hypothetical protein
MYLLQISFSLAHFLSLRPLRDGIKTKQIRLLQRNRICLMSFTTGKLLCEGVDEFVSLRFLVGSAVGMNGTGFGNFIQLAGELFGILGSGSSITGSDSGTEVLLEGLQLADAGAVAEISRLAGTNAFDCRFDVSHCYFSLNFYDYIT